jgi:hypothetical protein
MCIHDLQATSINFASRFRPNNRPGSGLLATGSQAGGAMLAPGSPRAAEVAPGGGDGGSLTRGSVHFLGEVSSAAGEGPMLGRGMSPFSVEPSGGGTDGGGAVSERATQFGNAPDLATRSMRMPGSLMGAAAGAGGGMTRSLAKQSVGTRFFAQEVSACD